MPLTSLPRITVITPSLNRGRLLEQTMCSVIDQGYENLEYLVMDGGSEDESIPLIQHYDDDIAYWQSQRDSGPAEAINAGIRRATGDWVMVLGPGDVLLPGVLHLAGPRLAATSADWLVGHRRRIDDAGPGRGVTPLPTNLTNHLMFDAEELPTPATFHRRSLFARHGLFDAGLRHAFGYEMSCRLLAVRAPLMRLPQTVYAHPEPDVSQGAGPVVKHGRELIDVSERYVDYLPPRARYALWKSCEERRRIYDLAEAEATISDARQHLWQQLLGRPSWLMSETFRDALLREAGAAQEALPPRRAAA